MKKTIADKLWDKTGLSFWSDYGNLIRPSHFNWVNFTWIKLDMEWDKMDNSFCIEAGILGLNMRWQVSLPGTTKQRDKLMKRLKDVIK